MACCKPYIAIEGNIGSGKTTVLKILKDTQPSLFCIEEPVSAFEQFSHHNPLKLSYENPQTNAAIAQHHIIAQACKHYGNKSLLPSRLDHDCMISERSILSPLAFIQNGLLNGTFSSFVSDYLSVELVKKSMNCRPPDFIIYLDVPANRCHFRMLNRGRESEQEGCSQEFLEKLECCYKEVLNTHSDTSKTRVFWLDLSGREPPIVVARRVLELIKEKISGRMYDGKMFAEAANLYDF